MKKKKLILLILDGWGYSENTEHNAIALSNPKNFQKLWDTCPKTLISASEESVGLPSGQMGNSEVGHTNLGAGRIVYQDFLKINLAVEKGEIADNKNITDFYSSIVKDGTRLHFFGLLSDGGVHSHIDHLKGLAKLAKDKGVKDIYIHAFMDGRDTPPKSGADYMKELVSYLEANECGKVASVTGRYYAMDRDKRWDRVEMAYKALRNADGIESSSALSAVTEAYVRGETDEFIRPTIVRGINGKVEDGDGVFFFNFRADRARELTDVFMAENFDGFDRGEKPKVKYLTMTEYEKAMNIPAAFPPTDLSGIFGEVVSKAGLKQLRIAETEKYAHVTYFFNGGLETVFEGEERALIPSPKEVATYDMKPSMSIDSVADKFKEIFLGGNINVAIMNFANPDMVGHTGIEAAAIAACKAVDAALGKVIEIADKEDAVLLVTADHGNCEQMWDEENHQPHTAHTLNKVPFIVYNYQCKLNQAGGKLADVAPTMLEILGLPQPAEMTGSSLLD